VDNGDFNKALNYSFLLLKYRARSKWEINSRLKKKGYQFFLVDKVIIYLESNNYLNDKEFVNFYVSCSLDKGWGPKKIDFNLKKLGISIQLRKEVLFDIGDCSQKIIEFIQRKTEYYKKENIPKKIIWQRIIRSLLSKGFSHKDIITQMQNFGVNIFEN